MEFLAELESGLHDGLFWGCGTGLEGVSGEVYADGWFGLEITVSGSWSIDCISVGINSAWEITGGKHLCFKQLRLRSKHPKIDHPPSSIPNKNIKLKRFNPNTSLGFYLKLHIIFNHNLKTNNRYRKLNLSRNKIIRNRTCVL